MKPWGLLLAFTAIGLGSQASYGQGASEVQQTVSFFSSQLGDSTSEVLASSSGKALLIGAAKVDNPNSKPVTTVGFANPLDYWKNKRIKARTEAQTRGMKTLDDFDFETSSKKLFPVKIYSADQAKNPANWKSWDLLFAFENDGDFVFGELKADPDDPQSAISQRISWMKRGDEVYIMGGPSFQTYRVGRLGNELVVIKTSDKAPAGFQSLTLSMIQKEIAGSKPRTERIPNQQAMVDERKMSGGNRSTTSAHRH